MSKDTGAILLVEIQPEIHAITIGLAGREPEKPGAKPLNGRANSGCKDRKAHFLSNLSRDFFELK